MVDTRRSYYDDVGCCLTCDDFEREWEVRGWNGITREGCLCRSCKCTICDHYKRSYASYSREGKCGLTEPEPPEIVIKEEEMLDNDWIKFTVEKIGYMNGSDFEELIKLCRDMEMDYDNGEGLWIGYATSPTELGEFTKRVEDLADVTHKKLELDVDPDEAERIKALEWELKGKHRVYEMLKKSRDRPGGDL